MSPVRFLLLSILLCASPSAFAEEVPNPHVLRGKQLYDALEYEQCASELELAHQATSTPRELAEAELYKGLCDHGLGRFDEARRHLSLALNLERSLTLPPGSSPKVRAFFDELAATIPAESPTARVTDAPLRAEASPPLELTPRPEEPGKQLVVPVAERRPNLTPSYVLGGTSIAALVAGIALGLNGERLAERAEEERFDDDYGKRLNAAQTASTLSNVSYGVAGVTAVAAAVVTWWQLREAD